MVRFVGLLGLSARRFSPIYIWPCVFHFSLGTSIILSYSPLMAGFWKEVFLMRLTMRYMLMFRQKPMLDFGR